MFTSPEPVTLSREARRGRGSEPRPSNALPIKGRARLPPSRDFQTRFGLKVLDASSFSQFAITLRTLILPTLSAALTLKHKNNGLDDRRTAN